MLLVQRLGSSAVFQCLHTMPPLCFGHVWKLLQYVLHNGVHFICCTDLEVIERAAVENFVCGLHVGACLDLHVSVCLLSVCLSIYLSVCLSVCPLCVRCVCVRLCVYADVCGFACSHVLCILCVLCSVCWMCLFCMFGVCLCVTCMRV